MLLYYIKAGATFHYLVITNCYGMYSWTHHLTVMLLNPVANLISEASTRLSRSDETDNIAALLALKQHRNFIDPWSLALGDLLLLQ